jgi:hypothetical protein
MVDYVLQKRNKLLNLPYGTILRAQTGRKDYDTGDAGFHTFLIRIVGNDYEEGYVIETSRLLKRFEIISFSGVQCKKAEHENCFCQCDRSLTWRLTETNLFNWLEFIFIPDPIVNKELTVL